MASITGEAKEELADLVIMRKLVRELTDGSRTHDTEHITSSMKLAESMWEELKETLAQREAEAEVREQQLHQFEVKKDSALKWLQQMERKVGLLEPAALDLDIIKCQLDTLEV